MPSPTQKSLELYKKRGVAVSKVEHWNAFAKRRIDLFGVIDLVALDGGIVGVQTTSASNVSARMEKIRKSANAADWLKCGGRLEVHGWGKRGARGKRKLWTCRVVRAVLGESGIEFAES